MNQPIFNPLPPLSSDFNYEIVGESKYDFDKNLLIFDVKTTLDDGSEFVETRAFEVKSLKIKKKGLPDPINLVGARTQEAMDEIAPLLIQNIKKNVDPKKLFSRNLKRKHAQKTLLFNGAQIADDDADSEIAQEQFSSQLVDQELTLSLESQWKALWPRDDIHDNNVQDQEALNSLLKHSQWEKLIRICENGESEHIWDMRSLSLFSPNPRARELAQFFKDHETVFTEASSRFEELSNLQTLLEGSLNREKVGIIAIIKKQLNDFNSINLNDIYLNPDAFTTISAQKERLKDQLIRAQRRLSRVKQALSLQQDLAYMLAIEEIHNQASLLGSAPMSPALVRNWSRLIDHYSLIPAQVDGQNLSDALMAHLAKKLGLDIEAEDFNNSLEEGEEVLKNIENDRAKNQARAEEEQKEDLAQEQLYDFVTSMRYTGSFAERASVTSTEYDDLDSSYLQAGLGEQEQEAHVRERFARSISQISLAATDDGASSILDSDSQMSLDIESNDEFFDNSSQASLLDSASISPASSYASAPSEL